MSKSIRINSIEGLVKRTLTGNLLTDAISIGSQAYDQMALYCYLSKCCTISPEEVRATYSSAVCNNTCVMPLYAQLIVEKHSVEELASLFLRGEEVYASIVAALFDNKVAFA